MPVGHFQYNPQTAAGARLKSAMTRLEGGVTDLIDEVDTMIQMKNGATLDAYAAGQYGFPDADTANSALAELEAVKGALNGIAAALNQAFAKFRN